MLLAVLALKCTFLSRYFTLFIQAIFKNATSPGGRQHLLKGRQGKIMYPNQIKDGCLSKALKKLTEFWFQCCLDPIIGGDGSTYTYPEEDKDNKQGQMLFSWFITSSKQLRDLRKMGKLAIVKREILVNCFRSRDNHHRGSGDVSLVHREAASRSLMSQPARLKFCSGDTCSSLESFRLSGTLLLTPIIRGHRSRPIWRW